MVILGRGYCSFIVLVFIIMLVSSPLYAADQNLLLPENKIKAGLLYNFLKYTTWPDSGRSSIELCVFGRDPFDGLLDPMNGRTVNQKGIYIHFISDVDETTKCSLIFVNRDKRDKWPELHKILAGKSVLTVSDFDSFIDEGGMIEFSKRGNRVEAGLNLDALKSAKLHVKDNMLKLVTVVK